MKCISVILSSSLLFTTYPSALNKTMDSLHLSSNKVTNVYKINQYVTRHVAYDWETYFDKASRDSAADALLGGKASCLGSATLFKDMCKKADIQAKVVKGTFQGEKHAWNIVTLHHQNYLVDTVQGHFLIGKKSAKDYHASKMSLSSSDLTPIKKNYRHFGYYKYQHPHKVTLKINYDATSKNMQITRTRWYANQKVKMTYKSFSCQISFKRPGDYCITAMNTYSHKKLKYYFMIN